jgi:mono/diheme cytochrome c family protein
MTMSIRRLAVVSALCVAAMASAPAVMAEELTTHTGEQLFQRFCSSCHGKKGEGDGPVAATFKSTVPDLSLRARRRGGQFPTDLVRRVIDGRDVKLPHGTRDMPVWGQEFWSAQGANDKARQDATLLIERLITHLVTLQH